jgi:hypothetical protein
MQLDDLAKRTPQSAFSQTPYFDAVLWFFSVLKRKSRWQNLSSCVCGNTSTIGSVLSSFLASSKVWKSPHRDLAEDTTSYLSLIGD